MHEFLTLCYNMNIMQFYAIFQLKMQISRAGDLLSPRSINFSWRRPKDCLPNNCAILKTCYSMILLVLLSAIIATFWGNEVYIVSLLILL